MGQQECQGPKECLAEMGFQALTRMEKVRQKEVVGKEIRANEAFLEKRALRALKECKEFQVFKESKEFKAQMAGRVLKALHQTSRSLHQIRKVEMTFQEGPLD